MDLLTTDYYVTYKSREPDPGICRVITVDWENKELSVTNNAVRLFPKFDEVQMWWSSDKPCPRCKSLFMVVPRCLTPYCEDCGWPTEECGE